MEIVLQSNFKENFLGLSVKGLRAYRCLKECSKIIKDGSLSLHEFPSIEI